MALPIAQLMKSPVILAEADENVHTALQRMEQAGVRHLPVVDAKKHLVGIVSERDLGRAVAVMETAEGRRERLRVSDVMQRNALRVPRTMPAHEAAAMMIAHKIGMLPVLDDKETVCGIVTATDFLEVAREALLGVDPQKRARA